MPHGGYIILTVGKVCITMADKKKGARGGGRSSSSGRSDSGRTNGSKRSVAAKKSRRSDKAQSSFAMQLTPFIVAVAAILVAVCMFAGDGAGIVGGAIRAFLLGLFGGSSYALPVFILIPVVLCFIETDRIGVKLRTISSQIIYILISVLLHIFMHGEHTMSPATHWNNGISGVGGGVVGGVIGEALLRGFGKTGSLVIIFALLFIVLMYTLGITPRGLGAHIRHAFEATGNAFGEMHRDHALHREKIEEDRRRRAAERQTAAEECAQLRIEDQPMFAAAEEVYQPTVVGQKYRYRRKNVHETDIPLDDDELHSESDTELSEQIAEVQPSDELDERIFEEAMRRTAQRRANEQVTEETSEVIEAEETDSVTDEISDASSLFVNPEDAELFDRLAERYLNDGRAESADGALEVSRANCGEVVEMPLTEAAGQVEYMLPPISILTEDTSSRDVNVKAELHDNAVKLVDTLRSFNVKTKIENVSRGPTITRYELLPEPGTRVRSIVNLVDDISLNLATTGVRIEAPIPGKPAVGIEVPNKKRATVHLRTLLEDERFASSPSKMTCALGEDVGGEAVYLDVAKMPHLLIAGATGMGKSVCINSLIVSILYKAKPDEVKLILIDPKKVELNIYNGIPHLLVPVVSDPKKAAGSLSWAVSEMERRFGLIEAVGVRDINMYNKVTERDPEYEYLPYIVIIIDELADLMMTAPDDVEESICRLMQKARAAGMHVIIGTQRPSVDVITGLIKANIPSRIAFTVASQVDSRTIIDRSGAESLIGRGDMLYIPVGSSKPIRVQGAFVSEEDVEKVVTFIKDANSTETNSGYSDDVMEEIEKAAAKCGIGKKGVRGDVPAGDDADEDPKLREALELAVNSGKISTSLIQRRLSLGYGRAAKLIDRMEQLGYVSAPEGQKPREVLLTKEQYMEMVLRTDDTEEAFDADE